MARSTHKPPTALRAILAAAAAAAFTASLAIAQPASANIGKTAVPASCKAADLHVSVPAAIAGDPDQGMGKRSWNIVFRNSSATACALRGWPRITVQTAAGRVVPTKVTDVNYSNLTSVPAARVVLAPGSSAVVTATSATAPAHCVSRWSLGVGLPGAAGTVPVREPSGSFVPCVGGQLGLSPFYSEQTLTADIKALSTSAAPSPFAAATAAEPATCATTALRAQVTSVASEHDGSIIELRLANTGASCVLPEGWPTVKLQMAGGSSQVAKIFADSAAVRPRAPAHHLPPGHHPEHGAHPAARRLGLRRAVRRGQRAENLPAGDLADRLPHRGRPRRGPHRHAGLAGAHLRGRPRPVLPAERPG